MCRPPPEPSAVAGTGRPRDEAAPAGGVAGHLADAARDACLSDVVHATHLIFLTASLIALTALPASVLIEEVPLRGKPDAATPEPRRAAGGAPAA